MGIFLKAVGYVLEFLRGPGETSVIEGETLHRRFSVTYQSDELQYEVECKRVIYETRFKRPLIPPMRRAIFEVQGRTISGRVVEKLEKLEIFPDLSSFGLLETKYPHVRAIAAYLDRVVSGNAVIHA